MLTLNSEIMISHSNVKRKVKMVEMAGDDTEAKMFKIKGAEKSC